MPGTSGLLWFSSCVGWSSFYRGYRCILSTSDPGSILKTEAILMILSLDNFLSSFSVGCGWWWFSSTYFILESRS